MDVYYRKLKGRVGRSRLLWALVLAVLLALPAVSPTVSPSTVHAAVQSHGRAAQLSWQTTGTNTASFHSTVSFRRSFYPTPPNVGDDFDVGSEAAVNYGDGFPSDSVYRVTYVDTVNDYFIATKDSSHTYATAGPWTAYIEGCCRLSEPQHINNPNQSFRLETIVDFTGTTASPENSLPPIVDCPRNAVCSFQIAAVDPDNQPMRFRMATPAEAGSSSFVQPGPPSAPQAATVSPTGRYSWNTTGATLNTSGEGGTYYSTQVMIENLNSSSQVVTKTPVDFFIRLSTGTPGNNPPAFTPPTPADGGVFTACAGQRFTISVQANDPDAGNTVTLTVINPPRGSTFITGGPGNPVSGTFIWTPASDQLGQYVINVVASDQDGAQSQRSYTINVGTVCPCAINYTDVQPGDPYYPFIQCLTCRSIISGYGDNTFRPSNNVTRQQLAKMVSNSLGLMDDAGAQIFTDVPPSNQFYPFINRLTRRGVMGGYSSPTDCPGGAPCFKPDSNASRGQIAKIVSNGAGFADDPGGQVYTDVPPDAPFYPFINRLSNRALIGGFSSASQCPSGLPCFRPDLLATRGQTSKIVSNTFFPDCQTNPSARGE